MIYFTTFKLLGILVLPLEAKFTNLQRLQATNKIFLEKHE